MAFIRYRLHNTRDNRYFKYGIQVLNSMLDFHDVRIWFTQTYGTGNDLTRDEPIENKHWGFIVKYQHYIIYIKGEEELNWFKLRYGDTELSTIGES